MSLSGKATDEVQVSTNGATWSSSATGSSSTGFSSAGIASSEGCPSSASVSPVTDSTSAEGSSAGVPSPVGDSATGTSSTTGTPSSTGVPSSAGVCSMTVSSAAYALSAGVSSANACTGSSDRSRVSVAKMLISLCFMYCALLSVHKFCFAFSYYRKHSVRFSAFL